jgi:hypothetical protein
MIMIRKASWSIGRAIGIILSWIAITTFLGFQSDFPIGKLDFHLPLTRYFGFSPGVIFTIALLGLSLWMSLRISYRTLLRNIHEKIVVPSVKGIRDVTLVSTEEDRTITKTDKYKSQVKELEEKIDRLSKERDQAEKKKTPPPRKNRVSSILLLVLQSSMRSRRRCLSRRKKREADERILANR